MATGTSICQLTTKIKISVFAILIMFGCSAAEAGYYVVYSEPPVVVVNNNYCCKTQYKPYKRHYVKKRVPKRYYYTQPRRSHYQVTVYHARNDIVPAGCRAYTCRPCCRPELFQWHSAPDVYYDMITADDVYPEY